MAFKGMYLKTGFLAAEGADVIVIWTQRKQSSANILKLVASILKGEADVVIGSRYLNGLERNTPIYLRIGQTILYSHKHELCLKITDF